MAELADHLAAIERDGYTVVDGVFDAGRAAAIVERLGELEVELGITAATNSFEGTATTRIYNLLAHGELFEQIAVDAAVLPIVEGVLDAECLVSTISSISIGPGETAQPIHADDQIMPLAKPHAATVCNSMWALTDFTEANGATRVVPGSHRADHSPEYGASFDSIPAEMARGSVLVWHGSLWHGGGANTTGARRTGIAMNYCAGWVRQQENQQLGIPLATIRQFSPRLRQLCGFDTYRGLIGHIDKQTPARRLLAAEPGDAMIWDAAHGGRVDEAAGPASRRA
ncbi:MAG: phytanoyl-CoA dioxygenase [Ilumatobacter sp.]|nr:phytanoyl-CoA dioxygenase [Ilumatobacter sp.]